MTDEQILDLFQRRDENASILSNEKYGYYCQSLISRILSNEEDTAECMNDLLLRVWEAIPPQRPGNLKMYLAKIARNLTLNTLRDKNATKCGSGQMSALLDELAECVSSGANPADSYQAKELMNTVNAFVRRLPRREGDLFIRRYFFAKSPGEIAGRYKMRKNTVAVHLSRTRKKILAYLIKEGFY